MKIVLFAPHYSRSALASRLARVDGIELVDAASAGEAAAALPTAEAILLPQDYAIGPMAPLLAACPPRLRWIQLLNAGYEHLRPDMLPSGVAVTNAGAGLAPAVAEHAIALLLGLTRGIPVALAAQRRQSWDKGIKQNMVSLTGRTVAVAGTGPIGRRIAVLLSALSASPVGISRSGAPVEEFARVYPVSDIAAAVGEADALVAALPQSPSTQGLFDARFFSRCRQGMFFVNVGRGSTVVMADLIAALRDGRLAGAGLDVTEPEPLPDGHPLWSAPNVIVTPHVAGGDGYRALADFVAANLERFKAGRELLSPVRLEATARGGR